MKEKERTRISFDPIPVTTNFWFLLVKAIHGARAHVRSPRRATGQKHSCTSNKQANAPPPRRKERQTNGSQRLFPHIPLVTSPTLSTLLHSASLSPSLRCLPPPKTHRRRRLRRASQAAPSPPRPPPAAKNAPLPHHPRCAY